MRLKIRNQYLNNKTPSSLGKINKINKPDQRKKKTQITYIRRERATAPQQHWALEKYWRDTKSNSVPTPFITQMK